MTAIFMTRPLPWWCVHSFGVSRPAGAGTVSRQVRLRLALFRQGTSTTDFGTTGIPNVGTLGVDLLQALFAPTISVKVNEKHTLGASLVDWRAAFQCTWPG